MPNNSLRLWPWLGRLPGERRRRRAGRPGGGLRRLSKWLSSICHQLLGWEQTLHSLDVLEDLRCGIHQRLDARPGAHGCPSGAPCHFHRAVQQGMVGHGAHRRLDLRQDVRGEVADVALDGRQGARVLAAAAATRWDGDGRVPVPIPSGCPWRRGWRWRLRRRLPWLSLLQHHGYGWPGSRMPGCWLALGGVPAKALAFAKWLLSVI